MRKLTFVIGIMGKGGAERVIANLANNFIQDNWEIDI
ncbi:TPA: glycosyltransferase, partial [Enterococcus faecium]|nr:glycosyltransferase [Enterococcus faecium]